MELTQRSKNSERNNEVTDKLFQRAFRSSCGLLEKFRAQTQGQHMRDPKEKLSHDIAALLQQRAAGLVDSLRYGVFDLCPLRLGVLISADAPLGSSPTEGST